MKVGLFFGTFDPIHNGHVGIADNVMSTNLIDQVWFVVTPKSPFKKNSIIASKEHRLKMVEIAIKQYPNFFSSNIEFQLESPQYTFKTLNFLESQFKDKYDFSIIMGLDNYISLLKKEWHQSEYLLNKYQMFIYQRNVVTQIQEDVRLSGLVLNNHIHLKGSSIEISSSIIRESLFYKRNLLKSNNHQQLDCFLSKKVVEYIKKNKLYTSVN